MLLGLIAVLGGSGSAQQTAPADPPPAVEDQAEPQPTFRTGIDFVRVDVIVTDDDGNLILDLEQADFEVFEDGVRQDVESFRLVQVTGESQPGEGAPRSIRTSSDEEVEASREDVRVFVIFLDDYHTRRGNDLSVREPLTEFITEQIGPRDLIGIMGPLTPVSDVRLTRNRDAILRTIARFEGRKWNYEPRNEFEYRYSNYPAEQVEQIRNEVSLSAIRALTEHLGGLREGRKSIIVVGEGYSNVLPPQLRDQNASLPGYGNPNRRDPFAGENSSVETTYRVFRNVELNAELQDVYNAANRNNASLYMLDPRGLATFEFDLDTSVSFTTDGAFLRSTQDTLRVLADETDGRAIVNMNDLSAGLRQMVKDSTAYYLLGYTSSQAPSDGKFHKIDVKVAGRPVKLRARRGFWALTPEAREAALAPAVAGPPSEVMTALGSLSRPADGRSIDTWIGTSRGEDGRARVTFVWAPAARVPGRGSDRPPAAVSLTASGDQVAPYFRGDVRNEPGTLANGGQRVVFDASPGDLLLRISVEGRDGDVIDRDVQTVAIPDFTVPQVALSTPVVLRAASTLEYRSLRDQPDAVPFVGREFRRTDRLLIRVSGYAPGDASPALAAELLNRGGQPMSDLPMSPYAAADGVYQIDLPLAGLAPGEYLIAITARASDGEARELIAFKLTS